MNVMKLRVPQLIGLIAVILILGGALFLFTRNQTPNTDQDQNTVAGNSETGTLMDILQFGENTTCTFSSEDGSGTIYVTSDKLRGDFLTPDGQSGSIIRDDEYTYVWSNAMDQGIRIENESYSMEEFAEGSETSDVIDPNAEVDYECSSWTVDPSVFTVPTDRQFMDISSQMEQLEGMEGMNQNGESACSACDSLSGEAQTTCRQQLC